MCVGVSSEEESESGHDDLADGAPCYPRMARECSMHHFSVNHDVTLASFAERSGVHTGGIEH